MENPIKMDDLKVPPFKETSNIYTSQVVAPYLQIMKGSHLEWKKILKDGLPGLDGYVGEKIHEDFCLKMLSCSSPSWVQELGSPLFTIYKPLFRPFGTARTWSLWDEN